MNKTPEFPMVQFGPGSQPQETDTLEYINMPKDMETYHAPILPEPEEVLNLTQGKQVLEDLLQALHTWKADTQSKSISLNQLDADNLDLINQALGEGEVSMVVGDSMIRAQESVLAGVWRIQHFDENNLVIHDSLEVGAVPKITRSLTFASADRNIDTDVNETHPGVQNAPALLAELADKVKSYQAGNQGETINLTLLPLTEMDVMLLGERLGVGPLTILSRGYGNCRIGSTAKENVWWIKYYNSQDVLILNTIEIVDIPQVTCAAPEDIEDSYTRLNEILELYR